MKLAKRWSAVSARLALNLSQTELAKRAGVSLSSIQRFELGGDLRGSKVAAILRELGGGMELLSVTSPEVAKASTGRHRVARTRPATPAAAARTGTEG